MNPMSHPQYAGLRYRELLAESEQNRQRSTLRRLARAARLQRRAAELARRATELVEHTHA